MKAAFTKKSLLVSVIADESTVTGFLLTGIGERAKDGSRNYLICNKETTDAELEEFFGKTLSRSDVGVILIS